jgi:hypothetical protein
MVSSTTDPEESVDAERTQGSRPGKTPRRQTGEKNASPSKMTTASPNSDGESIEFATASEFFDGRDEPDHGGPHFAKGIVWVDQLTPLFVCDSCHEHVEHLGWTGDGRADDYDEKRAEAYESLMAENPPCDVCAGKLPEKVER